MVNVIKPKVPLVKKVPEVHNAIVKPLLEITIKKVGILSCAVIGGIISFFIGVLAFLFSLIITSLVGSMFSSIPGDSLGFDFTSLILMPVLYGGIGFIGGAILGFFYNLSARLGKGIKIYS